MLSTTYRIAPRACPTLAVLALLLSGAPAAAQTVTDAVLDSARLVGTITLAPDSPRQALVFQNKGWRHVLFLAVPHAERHGVGGSQPGPGLCLEPGFTLAVWPDTVVITDLDGDRRDEIVALAGATITRVVPPPLVACGPGLPWPR
ncbi:MAG: hypothetical protein AB7R67_18815 [Vicinamibacterales bacterium]